MKRKPDTEPMDVVRLEIVRHGPPHNQLLSPLTNYLALCNDQGGETCRIEIEHGEFLDLLSAVPPLQEQADDADGYDELQTAALDRLRRAMTRFLGSLSSLRAEMGRSRGTTHLRLVLSAWELAALPFELADMPDFYPGAGRPMLLCDDDHIVLTRETRRVHVRPPRWPDRPRILFASADQADNPVPTEAHLLALYNAIEPWLGWSALSDDAHVPHRLQELREHLVVLYDASVRDIERACAAGAYTHVHILAHGALKPNVPSHRADYCVCLRSEDDPGEIDYVDGARLALALRPNGQRQPPSVVTLATCDAGNVGSLILGGGSVAHALHDAGISFVVASQFPLTKAGSVEMTRTLYEGFLSGEDPRRTLGAVRRRLYQLRPRGVDWASLVAYSSLEGDIGRQLQVVRATRLRKEADVAEFRARMALGLADLSNEEKKRRSKRFDGAMQRLQRCHVLGDRGEAAGRIASLLLRCFEGCVEAQAAPDVDAEPPLKEAERASQRETQALLAAAIGERREARQGSMFKGMPENARKDSTFIVSELDVLGLVERASDFYAAVYDADPSAVWGLAQHLILRMVLDRDPLSDLADLPRPRVVAAEVATLRTVAERAMAAEVTVPRRNRGMILLNDAREALVVALLLDLGLRTRGAALEDAAAKEEAKTTRSQVLVLMETIVREVDGGIYGFAAFSERRVVRRLARWLSAEFSHVREVASAADRRCQDLGVTDRWGER